MVAQHIDTLILARFVKYKCMQWHACSIWMAITMVATSRHLIMYKSHNPQILWNESSYSLFFPLPLYGWGSCTCQSLHLFAGIDIMGVRILWNKSIRESTPLCQWNRIQYMPPYLSSEPRSCCNTLK